MPPMIRRPTPVDVPFSRAAPTLTVISSNIADAAGVVTELRSDDFVVGRDVTSNLCLSDARLSRRHAALRADGGHVLLVDLSSTNGSWVNGVRCVKQRLHHGDSVRLGGTVFRFGAVGEQRASAEDDITRALACVHGNLAQLQQSFAAGSLSLEELDELVRDAQQSVEQLSARARAAQGTAVDDITPPVTRNVGGRS